LFIEDDDPRDLLDGLVQIKELTQLLTIGLWIWLTNISNQLLINYRDLKVRKTLQNDAHKIILALTWL
jgi:hypothetical protein